MWSPAGNETVGAAEQGTSLGVSTFCTLINAPSKSAQESFSASSNAGIGKLAVPWLASGEHEA